MELDETDSDKLGELVDATNRALDANPDLLHEIAKKIMLR
jgi:hypothetical protein